MTLKHSLLTPKADPSLLPQRRSVPSARCTASRRRAPSTSATPARSMCTMSSTSSSRSCRPGTTWSARPSCAQSRCYREMSFACLGSRWRSREPSLLTILAWMLLVVRSCCCREMCVAPSCREAQPALLCGLRRGNCCVQAALLLYGSSLVLHHGMPSQTLLAFMLYQGQLLEYFNVSAQTPIDPRGWNDALRQLKLSVSSFCPWPQLLLACALRDVVVAIAVAGRT